MLHQIIRFPFCLENSVSVILYCDNIVMCDMCQCHVLCLMASRSSCLLVFP